MSRLCGMSPYDPHMPGPGDIWSPPEDDGDYLYDEMVDRMLTGGL